MAAIKQAEQGNLDAALQQLTALVEKQPRRAASYNNRAQVHQMRRDADAAMADLDAAVALPMARKVAAQVYAQRGVLHRLKGDDTAAREDFERAGHFGNTWAQQQAIALNPYAALCNAMLSKAMEGLTKPACQQEEQ